MANVTRLLEWIFAFYFLTHIPVTVLLDMQLLLGPLFYPPSLTEFRTWYVTKFKDPIMLEPPSWFTPFMFCEAFLQLPFFPVAAYAFWKGNCKWIRIPAIIYATHVITTLLPILAYILLNDFLSCKYPSPQTVQERVTLFAVYSPYLVIPCLILCVMLFSHQYHQVEKKKKN
ncbi:sigma intracellular receptor 2 [Rhineura floridana]|uniref:sigma intracellular receptor 2 n=1 Tax=Rhineura floridana TaxID=261503 RepID=UPI002AC84844|nr:sigma intracellular receptor 2 [Rhineura floridana]